MRKAQFHGKIVLLGDGEWVLLGKRSGFAGLCSLFFGYLIRFISSRAGYHTAAHPTAMTVVKMRSMSLACTLTG